MSLIFLPGKTPRSSTRTPMANTLNDGSAAPTFRDEKRRLCPAFFCDASAPDQGDRGRAVELSADRQGLSPKPNKRRGVSQKSVRRSAGLGNNICANSSNGP